MYYLNTLCRMSHAILLSSPSSVCVTQAYDALGELRQPRVSSAVEKPSLIPHLVVAEFLFEYGTCRATYLPGYDRPAPLTPRCQKPHAARGTA